MAGKKRVVLELGGHAAVVVAQDADIDDAVKRIVTGAFGYAGQSCVSVQRIYVHETIAVEVMGKLVEGTRKLVVGDPLDEGTDVGPMIDEASAERLEQWIGESGGTILCGGGRRGRMFEPTLVADVGANTKLMGEEVFGPVAVVNRYEDFEEVLARVDETRYGLQAGIFSNEPEHIRRAFERLEVGTLVVNDVPTTRFENMPYGGVKDSGLGREGVRYAMEEMLERKVLLRR
jgi:acyl-CoA reductase-like NAD-dependent aldehyde dehydrogenase